MKWESLLALVGNEPVFSSALLLAGDVSPAQVWVQLSRWVKARRLIQLRRGLYGLAPTWRKVEPHPFVLANASQRGSYVSLQSALSYHGVIPEHVPVVTSVGPGRTETVRNDLGAFQFRHVARAMVFGYSRVEVTARQFAFVASPEKAVLDLVHLTPGADSPAYLAELRLQNPDVVDLRVLEEFARRTGKPKLVRAVAAVAQIFSSEEGSPL